MIDLYVWFCFVDKVALFIPAHMPGIAEKPLAWTELEARFARAMSQNADLIEQNERLEHVILQLQSENDTIGLWQVDL